MIQPDFRHVYPPIWELPHLKQGYLGAWCSEMQTTNKEYYSDNAKLYHQNIGRDELESPDLKLSLGEQKMLFCLGTCSAGALLAVMTTGIAGIPLCSGDELLSSDPLATCPTD